MAGFDANESLTPFQHGGEGRGADARQYGAILFDIQHARQVEPEWFSPAHWGERARPVTAGGRGGAWFIDAPEGPLVLRHYLRGGWAAHVSRDVYLWQGATRVRSFEEFRLTRKLHAMGLPVPRPLAAYYRRAGQAYRAAILLERLDGVHSFAERALVAGSDAPWEETGRLVARFHRAGLDHADLNAHNILFGPTGQGWLIDFDRCRLHIPATPWRESNLARLHRSMRKVLRGGDASLLDKDFARLRAAYDATWQRGY
ncbi:MAG TPA: 3-deoxy-D-manno-octulosonic acid kinase [Luteimonas sp.]|nr:3-deoxy-D-manno-octulosonic acid kinase [Luteimonas sp.]